MSYHPRDVVVLQILPIGQEPFRRHPLTRSIAKDNRHQRRRLAAIPPVKPFGKKHPDVTRDPPSKAGKRPRCSGCLLGLATMGRWGGILRCNPSQGPSIQSHEFCPETNLRGGRQLERPHVEQQIFAGTQDQHAPPLPRESAHDPGGRESCCL